MRVKLGINVVPDASDPQTTVGALVAADAAGLDIAGVQDHPYQRRFLDTWTLLSYTAARTERLRLVPDVINLPLRLPSVLAKSAASLDVLSFWSGSDRSTSRGSTTGSRAPSPAPLPRTGSGSGSARTARRMLRLTGRLGDGWLPSLGRDYLTPEDAPRMHAAVDDGARAANRDPGEIERAVNVTALEGAADGWADELARIATELRFSTILVALPDRDPVGFTRRLGEDVAPRVRELVGG